MTIDIRQLAWDSAAASGLRDLMDAEIHPRYAGLIEPGTMPPLDLSTILVTLVAFDGELPVATASLKDTEGFAEVKRVYVVDSHRRLGLAARLLTAVSDHAAGLGFADVVLQTGSQQPEAIALYLREGWLAIPPFGPYAHDKRISRCFAKPLVPLFVAAELPASGTAATFVREAVSAIRSLEGAGADLVVIADDLRPAATGGARLDAPTLAAFAAPKTSGIGLAPAIETTHTEPFHLAKVVQTLDHASRGRAAWQVAVATSPDEAALFGRKQAASPEDAWAEAEESIEVAERLWDSWEDDAEIRDVATGRFIDRAKVHHIDFQGRFFSVRGPSIVPRSPQGRPPIVISLQTTDASADSAATTSDPAFDVAVRRADIVRVTALAAVAPLRAALAEAGRETAVTVLVDVPVASVDPAALRDTLATLRHDTGADGVVLVFDALPADAGSFADAVRPFTRPSLGGTLRDRLGLERPLSRYVRTLEGARS